MSIEDVQNNPDNRNIPINKVGIKDISHPFIIEDLNARRQHSIGNFTMSVNLPHDVKGTHMSRFVALLNEADETVISIAGFTSMLEKMTHLLEAESGYLSVDFKYFVNKSAPVTGVQSLMDYQVSLSGSWSEESSSTRVKVVVPVTSLCPCSKKISDYGAHNQRSHVTVDAVPSQQLFIEDIINLVEAQASSELYALLKRPDEKFITERAYDNPKFVEDAVRDIANDLNNNPHVLSYVLEAENFESIHNHSAYAVIENTKQNN